MSFSFFNKKDKQQAGDNEIMPQENNVLSMESIKIGLDSVSKEEAIEMAGQLLVDAGHVTQEYIPAMKEREKVLSTYIGEGIAIPHGVGGAKDKIISTGISVLQFPEGVEFVEGEKAYLVVGIAGKGNEHMKILTNLAEFISEGQEIKKLFTTKDKSKIFEAFTNKI